MAERRDLLVELGTEELPPRALKTLRDALRDRLEDGLREAGLEPGEATAYASPRRLAVRVAEVRTEQPERVVERRGPAVAAAFDEDGQPTRAALGFARSCDVSVDQLERMHTDKGEWLAYRARQPGRAAAAVIPEVVERTLVQLPVPKRMRWGAEPYAFVRPVHWLVLLFGEAVVDMTVFGVRSGRCTRGHRFHAPEPLTIRSPDSYARQLREEGFVVADFDERRREIESQTATEAARLGGEAVLDDALLDEVTALVEWPVAIVGSFEERFLEVPPEALISSMQGHQRYFPVRDAAGRLMPRFITIANLASRDPAEVARGNERVIRPRLADADFFWHRDRRIPLSERIDSLKEIVFQQKLGSLYDKAVRVAALSRGLAPGFGVAPDTAEQAAFLARCDLLTEMVGEFPELQGIMGRYYAEHDGVGKGIPRALQEQYQPRFGGDSIPSTAAGQLLAVAERVDTLVGIFAIGEAPTGEKDPFALRRAGLGLMRILVEGERSVALLELLDVAASHLPADIGAEAAVESVFAFCLDRLKAYYLDQGFAPELFEAVRAARRVDEDGDLVPVDDPLDFDRRLRACAAFQRMEAASSLAAANKRVHNLLRRSEVKTVPDTPDPGQFIQEEERALYAVIQPLAGTVAELTRAGRYRAALEQLAHAREPVDAFFDGVMVMADETSVRENRLALLKQLSILFSSVADLSRLPGT